MPSFRAVWTLAAQVGGVGAGVTALQMRGQHNAAGEAVTPLPSRPQHVVVVGAGVVGVTTAYELARRGCAVTLVEQASDVAVGCSFANAGGIRFSKLHIPMAHPNMPHRLFAYTKATFLERNASSKLKEDTMEHQPLQFFSVGVSSWTDPVFYLWGTRFLYHCWFTDMAPRCQLLDALSRHSVARLQRTVADEGMQDEVQLRRTGSMNVFRSQEALERAVKGTEGAIKRGMDQPVRFLSHAQASELEPWLAAFTPCAGAVYNVNDMSGDCRQFVLGLTRRCVEKFGVKLLLNTAVTKLEVHEERGKVVVHMTAASAPGLLDADAVVVCAGWCVTRHVQGERKARALTFAPHCSATRPGC